MRSWFASLMIVLCALPLMLNAQECEYPNQVSRIIGAAYSAQLIFGSDQREYQVGEPINFCLSVKNFDGRSLGLTYPVANKTRFQIWNKQGGIVWRNVNEEVVQRHSESIPFLQSRILGRDAFTRELAPGQYVLMGQTTATSDTLWLSITVIPSQPARSPLQIIPLFLDFGEVVIGDTKSAFLYAINTVCDTIFVDSLSASNTIFTVEPRSLRVEPQCFGEPPKNPSHVTIEFSPSMAGSFSGVILFHSHYTVNSFGDTRFFTDTVMVQGKGVRPTLIEASGVVAPFTYDLSQNYPNPFNPTTTITFSIPKSDYVSLKIFDMAGREVATLVKGFVKAGTHVVEFDASGLATGTYLYRLVAGEFASVRRMILIK